MSSSIKGSHRQKRSPVYRVTTWTFVVFLGFVIAVMLTTRDGGGLDKASDEPSAKVTVRRPQTTVTASPSAEPHKNAWAVAEGMKPLKNLEKGDRVLLWRPDSNKPRQCVWVNWAGDLDFSNIRCHDDGLQINVHTAYLTPVEKGLGG